VVSYFGMWSNIVFAVPLDMLAASEAVHTFQDFARGGAMRYTAGGYGRVAEAFAQAVQCTSGEVRLRTPVERIVIENGAVAGVRCADATYRAPIVVSSAGLQPTVLRLVGEEHFDPGYVSYVKNLSPSWGLMGVRYFLDQPVFRYPVYIAYSDDSYWDSNRFLQAKAGHLPDDVLVFMVIPSQYDTALAPEGRQCVLAATLCSPDPSSAGGPDAELLWDKLEETVERLWPEIIPHVETKERYSTAQVSALTRDQVLPGQGGECIGLAQIVGQYGRHSRRPRSVARPLAVGATRGLAAAPPGGGLGGEGGAAGAGRAPGTPGATGLSRRPAFQAGTKNSLKAGLGRLAPRRVDPLPRYHPVSRSSREAKRRKRSDATAVDRRPAPR
jgi:prolycopene isomerase